MSSNMVMYVVLRKDLLTKLGWPTGAAVAQACHASTAVLWLFRSHPDCALYAADVDRMRKVVLEIESEDSLRTLAEKLTDAKIDHKLWVEQPENSATCLATRPAPKTQVQPHLSHLKTYS